MVDYSRSFKVSIPCGKPQIGFFSERVLGLICLWSTGAIVVGCSSWHHQWPWWDLNPFTISRKHYPLSHGEITLYTFRTESCWVDLLSANIYCKEFPSSLHKARRTTASTWSYRLWCSHCYNGESLPKVCECIQYILFWENLGDCCVDKDLIWQILMSLRLRRWCFSFCQLIKTSA